MESEYGRTGNTEEAYWDLDRRKDKSVPRTPRLWRLSPWSFCWCGDVEEASIDRLLEKPGKVQHIRRATLRSQARKRLMVEWRKGDLKFSLSRKTDHAAVQVVAKVLPFPSVASSRSFQSIASTSLFNGTVSHWSSQFLQLTRKACQYAPPPSPG